MTDAAVELTIRRRRLGTPVGSLLFVVTSLPTQGQSSNQSGVPVQSRGSIRGLTDSRLRAGCSPRRSRQRRVHVSRHRLWGIDRHPLRRRHGDTQHHKGRGIREGDGRSPWCLDTRSRRFLVLFPAFLIPEQELAKMQQSPGKQGTLRGSRADGPNFPGKSFPIPPLETRAPDPVEAPQFHPVRRSRHTSRHTRLPLRSLTVIANGLLHFGGRHLGPFIASPSAWPPG